jgi:hypothetical protein
MAPAADYCTTVLETTTVSLQMAACSWRERIRRVGGGVAPTASHRSGRAQLTHPARHAAGLRALCYPTASGTHVAGARSPRRVSRCRLRRAVSPSLDRVLAARVPRLPRYYETLRPLVLHLTGLIAVARRYRRRVLSFAPPSGRRTVRRAGGLGSGGTPTARRIRRRGQVSQVPGGSCGRFARVLDPGRTDTPGRYGVPTRPPLVSRTRAADDEKKFRGSMSELSAWRPTLRGGGHPTPRKACFRLLARSTGWEWLPTEPRRKVSAMQSLHPFPLSQASPGAMTPSIPVLFFLAHPTPSCCRFSEDPASGSADGLHCAAARAQSPAALPIPRAP